MPIGPAPARAALNEAANIPPNGLHSPIRDFSTMNSSRSRSFGFDQYIWTSFRHQPYTLFLYDLYKLFTISCRLASTRLISSSQCERIIVCFVFSPLAWLVTFLHTEKHVRQRPLQIRAGL
jgi:hypothetical protein